jgi:methylphosphotriester-DNA--protein-cysteine methyltransferase
VLCHAALAGANATHVLDAGKQLRGLSRFASEGHVNALQARHNLQGSQSLSPQKLLRLRRVERRRQLEHDAHDAG